MLFELLENNETAGSVAMMEDETAEEVAEAIAENFYDLSEDMRNKLKRMRIRAEELMNSIRES